MLCPSPPLAVLSELIAVGGVMTMIGTWHMFHQWGIILARLRVSGGAEHISQDAAGKRYISNSCQLFYFTSKKLFKYLLFTGSNCS
jgi:hypothetical protein